MLKKYSLSLVLAGLLLASGLMAVHAPTYARMPEPSTVPAALQGTSPHTPTVSRYYLDELVCQGKMTKVEAEKTQQYLVFRHKRRQQDLKNVEHDSDKGTHYYQLLFKAN